MVCGLSFHVFQGFYRIRCRCASRLSCVTSSGIESMLDVGSKIENRREPLKILAGTGWGLSASVPSKLNVPPMFH